DQDQRRPVTGGRERLRCVPLDVDQVRYADGQPGAFARDRGGTFCHRRGRIECLTQRPLSGLGEGLRGRRIRASGRYGKGVRIVAATVTDEAAPGAGGGHGGRATRKRLRARRREAGSMASAAATRAARARRVRAVGCSVAGAVPDEWIEST